MASDQMKLVDQQRLTANIESLPNVQNYKNSTKVMTIKGQPIFVEDIIKAGLISRSNMLLLGARGRGKTTLEHDIIDGFFGGNGVYVRAHPKMDEKELFTHLNIGKFLRGELQSDHELREVLSNIKNNCMIVDEITRLPGITQNRVYGLADGYIELDGVRYQIGNGYSVLVASGNVGSNYTGTFQLDDALIDRFPIILNVQDYLPRALDTFTRLIEKHDPRVPATDKNDHTSLLKEIYHEIKNLEATVMMAIATQYLITALNDCVKYGYNKLQIANVLPQKCDGCAKLAEGCGYYQGVSERSGEAIVGLTLALQQVAIAKHSAAKKAAAAENSAAPDELLNDEVNDVLETFRTFFGYTGILNAQKVMQDYFGNPAIFMTSLATVIKREFTNKLSDLQGIVDAIKNSDEISDRMLEPFTKDVSAGAGAAFKNPWRFISELVRGE
ncbi:MAG: AAA family ATPase [Candidatus Micrarchaeota archaeon]|nr:AAA family ATPase [Candidatus Micrarchaeota archaeon]